MASNTGLASYAQRLYERRHDAVSLRRVEANVHDWKPTRNECHRNVDLWCEYHSQREHFPQYKPVRGWLHFDYLGAFDHVHFAAHSVVETEDGELLDITPSLALSPYPFIRAQEDETAYASLVMENGLRQLKYFPATRSVVAEQN